MQKRVNRPIPKEEIQKPPLTPDMIEKVTLHPNWKIIRTLLVIHKDRIVVGQTLVYQKPPYPGKEDQCRIGLSHCTRDWGPRQANDPSYISCLFETIVSSADDDDLNDSPGGITLKPGVDWMEKRYDLAELSVHNFLKNMRACGYKAD